MIVNIGSNFIRLQSSPSNSNLYVPDAAQINPGGTIHLIYVDNGKGFRGWVTIGYVPNVGTPGGGG